MRSVFSCLHASMALLTFHVVKAGARAVIGLGTAEGPVKLVKVHGMKDRDVVRAVRLVTIWKAHLLATWKTIHGE